MQDIANSINVVTDHILEVKSKVDTIEKSYVTKDEIQVIQGNKGADGAVGPAGKDGARGPMGPQGPKGDMGPMGIMGPKGVDGNDGSPDSAESIRAKLESLQGEERIDLAAIRGSEKLATKKDLEKASEKKSGGISVAAFTGNQSSGSVTVGPNEIAYGDNTGTVTSDADHTLLADGTLNLESTFGDVTGSFIQRVEPTLGNAGIWGTTSTNNSTGATITHGVIDGTNIPDLGSDSVLATISEFPATGVEVNTFIGVVGAIRGVIGPTWEISENFVDGRYELSVYDTSIPTGSNIFAFSNGAGLTSRDLTSNSTGYPVYALYGSTYVDDSGVTSRVATGKDIVDYVQTGTSISVPNFIGTGLDDFSAAGNYTGAYTGSYSVTVIGNDGNSIAFNAGMTTGQQFNVGETVTGSISGATATVSQGTSDTSIWVYNISGTFVLGDILTGSSGNVSTAVTLAVGANGDLFEVNYTDIGNTNVQWFTGNQANPTPFNGIGGITFEFTSSGSGHTPNDRWTFTAAATYDEKQKVDATGTVFSNNTNQTTTHSQDIPITEKITLSPAQVNSMNTTTIASGINVPAGYFVQILDIVGKIKYNSSPYATNTTINIAYESAPTQSVWQQNSLLTDTATTFRRFTKTSGSGADVILPEKSLRITNTAGDPTAGDSDVTIYITYKLVAA